jgi:crossover junction endodeoxyribonuclease RuvC
MIVLGIDPGTAKAGYGIIKIYKKKPRLVNYGCITTPKGMTPELRLKEIFNQIVLLIRKNKPSVLALERLFFNRNAKTVTAVGRATGVIMLAAAKARIPVYEYMPLQIKSAIDGYGRASKRNIQKRVLEILQLDEIPKPDDAADALAVAICHHFKVCGKLK